MTHTTDLSTLKVYTLSSGKLAVGFDTGDRDECGTEHEVATVEQVLVFEFGQLAGEFPVYGLLVSSELSTDDADFEYLRSRYLDTKLSAAEMRLYRAQGEYEAAKSEARSLGALSEALFSSWEAEGDDKGYDEGDYIREDFGWFGDSALCGE